MSHKAHRDLPRVSAVGAREDPEVVTCRRGNNPFGHPAECSFRRASQSVPYWPDEDEDGDE